MKRFKTDEEAIEYATKEIGKYGSIICIVDGKLTFLSATSLPIEERLREPIENMVREFLKEIGIEDEYENEDISNYIGAEMCNKVEEMIEKQADIKILSAYMDF